MSSIPLLRKLGIYIQEQFLSTAECESLCKEMQGAPKTSGNVCSENSKREFRDLDLRRTQTCQISHHSHNTVASRILMIKTELQQSFQDQYSEIWEEPKFLQYKAGDYFLPHTDNQAHRRLNISIYLNNQSRQGVSNTETNTYSGGELTLYGLIKSPGWQKRGISIPGIQGMLVAYPVDITHEVTAVTSGSRYAIVSRFLSPAITA